MSLSPEEFLKRLRTGQVVNCTYRNGDLVGLISAWAHEGRFVLKWEECHEGDQYNEMPIRRMIGSYSRAPKRCWHSWNGVGIPHPHSHRNRVDEGSSMTTENQTGVLDEEAELAEIRGRLGLSPGSPDPRSRWWENLPPPIPGDTPENEAIYEARGKYIRQTGDLPPIDWVPGDPIPEPEHWK